MRTALTIAGSDSSGGAGIQADIKTMTTNGVYAMSAVTALTAQNTTGVFAIHNVPQDFLASQLDAIFHDIFPDAVKIGMLSDGDLIQVTAEKLSFYKPRNIVLDPVMVSTSGSRLLSESALSPLLEKLFPIARLVTPNIPEAEILCGFKIFASKDMEKASKRIYDTFGCPVLLKGGHFCNDANDVLYEADGFKWFYGKRASNPNTHGTGCTLSSAIAANLAKGFDLRSSIAQAKRYVEGALSSNLNLGQGSGPLNHIFDMSGEFCKGEKTND